MKYEGNHKYHYFYKITNKINGHYYYGIHSTNNLDDGYMGSGTVLAYAYKKYGKENFEKEILKYFESREKASEYELNVVNESVVKDKNSYNQVVGGDKFTTIGVVCAFDVELDLWVLIPREEYFENKDRYKTTTEGKVVIESGETYVTIDKEEYLLNKDKYKCLLSGSAVVKDKFGNYFRVSKNDPRIKSGELNYVQTGTKRKPESNEKAKRTFKLTKHQQGEKNSMFGKVWIHNGIESMPVKKEDADLFLSNGWKKGRKDKEVKEKKVPGYKRIDKDTLFSLHDQGMTWIEAGKQMGFSKGVVEKFLREIRKNK